VARIRDANDAYTVLVGKSLYIPARRQKDNINTCRRDKDRRWAVLVQNSVHWQAFVLAALTF
jgi:hypothetical protein